MKDLSAIYEHKKSDVAVFLGCGSSINKISKSQWRKINAFDTWTSNHFIYHPRVVPNFYHLELKSSKTEWLKNWRQRKIDKGKAYKNVNFIVMRGRQYLLDAIGEHEHIYSYERKKGKCNPKDAIHPTIVTHNCNASFTLILELLYRFKYNKVVLFGVDLHDSRYFWTGRPEYGKVHDNTNRGRRQDVLHTTAGKVQNFVIGFNKHKMKGRIFVGYKDTLLYPKLKFVDIMEI